MVVRSTKRFSTGGRRGDWRGVVAWSLIAPAVVLSACTYSSRLALLHEGSVVSPSAQARARADLIYYLLAGEFALRRADYPAAAGYYREAVRRSDDLEVLKSAFKLALHDKDYAAAIGLAERWRARDPDNVELKQMLAVTYVMARRFEDAMLTLEDLVGREGVNQDRVFTTLGATLVAEMPLEAAERMEEMAERFSDNPRAQYVYAVFLLDTGAYDKVIEAAKKAVALDPGFANARLLQGWALISSGRVEEGLAEAAAAVEIAPDNANVRTNYAKLLLDNDRPEEALREFRLIHARHPHNPDVIQALGILSLRQGDLESASAFFEDLQAFPKRQVEAVYYKGRVAEAQGKLEVALAIYRAVPRGEFFKKAQISIAEVYRKAGDLKKSLEHLEAVRVLAEDEEERVEFYLVQGSVLGDAGRYREAIALYTRAMDEHGELTSLLYARGLAASELGLLARAEADFTQILKTEPDNADVLNAFGFTLADYNVRLDEAKRYIERALMLSPDNPAILDSMGWIEFRLHNVEVAERYVRRAMAAMRHPEVFGHLVEILCAQRRVVEAVRSLEEGLTHFPDNDYLQSLRDSCVRR